ncbi:hypothetical protein WDU94_006781 [Cyamophila willieti]
MLLTKPDPEHLPRRTNIQITLKKRDKRNKATEEKSTKEEIGAASKDKEDGGMSHLKSKGVEEKEKNVEVNNGQDSAAVDDVENKCDTAESSSVATNHPQLEVFWCQSCNLDFARDVDYLDHLQSSVHAKSSQKEQPWLDDHSLEAPSLPPPARLHKICLGAHWLIPVSAWYCKLCRECFADIRLAAGHLQSEQHCGRVQIHTVENPLWEITLLKTRTEAAQRKLNSLDKQLQPSTEHETANYSEPSISSGVTKEECHDTKQRQIKEKTETENPTPEVVAGSSDSAVDSSVKTKPRSEIFEDEDTREGRGGEKSKLWVPNRKAFDKMNKTSQQETTTSKKKPSFIGKMPSGAKGKIKINLPPSQGTTELSGHDDTAAPPGGVDSNLVANVENILSQLNTIYRNEQESWELSQEREILAAEREIARKRLLTQQDEETQDETMGQSSDEEKRSLRSRSSSSRRASSRGSSPRSNSSEDSNNTTRDTTKRLGELSNRDNRRSRDSSRSSREDNGSRQHTELDTSIKSKHSKPPPTSSKHSSKSNVASTKSNIPSLPKSNNSSTLRSQNTSSVSKESAHNIQTIDSESLPIKYINLHYDVDSSDESESQDDYARQMLKERKALSSAHSSSDESAAVGLDEAERRNRRYLSLMKKYVRGKENQRGDGEKLESQQTVRKNRHALGLQTTQRRKQRVSQTKIEERARSGQTAHAYRRENDAYDEEFDSEGIENRVSSLHAERDSSSEESEDERENAQSASNNVSRSPSRSIAEDSHGPPLP